MMHHLTRSGLKKPIALLAPLAQLLVVEDGRDSYVELLESLWSPPYTPAITPVASRSTAAPETPPNMRKSRAPDLLPVLGSNVGRVPC